MCGETVDYNELLKAIDDKSAVGSYLKADRSAYRSLRNGFNAAQSSFRRLTETPESSTDEVLFEENQQNWLTVNQACWQTLTEKSKDIEIYCWWVMSLAFQDQAIVKIASALKTLVDFIDIFWPDVHPYLPDKKLSSTDEVEQKKQRAELQLRPLIQLLGESTNSGLLFMPLQLMTLVANIDHGQYFSATKANNLSSLKSQAQQKFSSVKAETTDIIQALDHAISSLEQLDVWLKKTINLLAIPTISTRFLKANLTDNLQAIKYLVADCYAVWPLDALQQFTGDSMSTEVIEKEKHAINQQVNKVIVQSSSTQPLIPSTSALTAGQLKNRDHAFQELRKIANYFAKQEPHSPISFLLEKAIRWGYMSLPELMVELVGGNDKVLDQINLVAGLNDDKADIIEPKLTTEVAIEQPVVSNEVKDKEVIKTELTAHASSVKAAPESEGKSKPNNEFSW